MRGRAQGHRGPSGGLPGGAGGDFTEERGWNSVLKGDWELVQYVERIVERRSEAFSERRNSVGEKEKAHCFVKGAGCVQEMMSSEWLEGCHMPSSEEREVETEAMGAGFCQLRGLELILQR